jgi:hypothetical protein
MGIWWVPRACINPPGDNYYACYEGFAKALRPGVDLTSVLSPGTTFSFQMPSNVITSHKGTVGGGPYGLAVVFTVACAGHVQYVAPPVGAPADTLPLGCFDSRGVQLGPDDFVFAYSEIYAFTDRTVTNPVIQSVTLAGNTVDVTAGISLPHCTESNVDNCAATPVNVVVPASSDAPNPGDLGPNGTPLKEQIYVDYYLTAGQVKNDTVILYDPSAGALSNTADAFYAPQAVGDSWLWAVVHNNCGGASWLQVPVHAN